jgi:PTS system nitrogen regulatory IIA component
MNTIADLLLPEDILLDVDVSGKQPLFEEIGRHMERVHAMPQAWVVSSLDRREKAGSTGVGEGVAIPHARVKNLDRILAAYMRLKTPIFFDAPDDRPVSDVLVLLVPQQAADEHLMILADAMQMFSSHRFRKRLHLCNNPQEVKRLFMEFY